MMIDDANVRTCEDKRLKFFCVRLVPNLCSFILNPDVNNLTCESPRADAEIFL